MKIQCDVCKVWRDEVTVLDSDIKTVSCRGCRAWLDKLKQIREK